MDESAPLHEDAFELVADVMPLILSRLGPIDLCRLARTSRRMKELADDAFLWRDCLVEEAKLFVAPLALVDANNWKEIYRTKKRVESIEAWLAEAKEGDALLLPSGRYGVLSVPQSAPALAIIGLANSNGDPIVLQSTPPHNLCELTGASMVMRNITLRFPEAPAPTGFLRAWPAAIYLANGKLELDECRIEGGARQWGIALQHGASLRMRRCAIHNLLDSPLALWEGTSVDAQESEFINVGQVQLRGATAHMRRCTMLLKDVYEARLCYVGPKSSVLLEECRLTGRNHRCSGVSSWGSVTLRRCILDAFYFALTKREEDPVSIEECKFLANPRGGNAFLSSSRGEVNFVRCEFTGPFTSAIEVEEHGVLRLDGCRFSKAQCGVGLHGAESRADLLGCVLRECDTGVKVGVAATVRPQGSSFLKCATGVLLTGDPEALQSEALRIRQDNTFEACGTAVHVEAMEGDAAADSSGGVAPEVIKAVKQRICTFQVTGPHYRRQLVWRCNTCRLNNSRGVCQTCKDLCHEGHDLEPSTEPVRFFCDCGAERFCDTLRRAAPPLASSMQQDN